MALSEITNYLEDDWGDNSLTGRSNSDEGYFLHPSDNLISDYEAGDALKGVYRPEWEILQSSSVYTGNSNLQLSGTDNAVATPSNLDTGSWSFDFSKTSNTEANNYYSVSFFATTRTLFDVSYTRDGYAIFGNLNNEISTQIRKSDSGSVTDLLNTSHADDTATHTMEVTRSVFGEFELLYDGVSQGTTTDTTFTDTKYIIFSYDDKNGSGLTVIYDNLVVK